MSALSDMDASKTLREREAVEANAAIEKAERTGKSVTFISSVDGCEITATPTGYVFYNATEWW